jgi:hypothetical protein
MFQIKKGSKIYLVVLVIAITLLVIEVLKFFWGPDQALVKFKYLELFIAFFSILFLAFRILSKEIKSVKRLETRVKIWLGFNVEEDVVPVVNPNQLKHVKDLLLRKVDKQCKPVIDNIKKSSTIISAGSVVKTKQVFYEDILQYKHGQKVSYNKFPRYMIIGDPGNGKSLALFTAILEEIREVEVKRKNGNEAVQIPVYLSLNSWSKHLDLNDWLTERISREYLDCRKLKSLEALVGQYEIVPYVDGLDEVNSEDRVACFKALLTYEGERLVFSCRRQELNELIEVVGEDELSNGNIAIQELQHLSHTLIENTITSTKQEKAAEVIDFIHAKRFLFDFLCTPLRLNLFLKVYDKLDEAMKMQIAQMDEKELDLFLWEKYDETMFEEKYPTLKDKTGWSVTAVRTYMVWLAKKMNGTSFFIEDLQPVWLGNSTRVLLYYLTSRIISGIVLAIAAGLFIAEATDFIGNAVFACICIVMLTLALNRVQKNKQYSKFWLVVLFASSQVMVTGLYQGFAVPRLQTDMFKLFSKTESLAGILLGLFFGVIFGYRKYRQNAIRDVHPLEHKGQRFKLNVRNALKTGLNGGTGIGLFLGASAIFIHAFLGGNTFDKWFAENISRLMAFTYPVFSEQNKFGEYVQMGLLGFLMGFLVGFIVFALLGGRDPDTDDAGKKDEPDNNNLFKLNTGIIKSFKYSLIYGIGVMLIIGSVYGFIILFLTKSYEGLSRAVSMGLGTGIISMLWFGGFEVIQHWTLRLYLYLYGITPLRYSKWVEVVVNSALVRRVGTSLQFYHQNLKQYYASIPLNDRQKRITDLQNRQLQRLSILVFVVVIIGFLLYPMYIRINDGYWQSANELICKTSGPGLRPLSSIPLKDTAFTVNKTGALNIMVTGKVKVGTFAGRVDARGTETGLMGFPISDVYDVEPHCRHGALIYQVVHGSIKSNWAPVVKTPAQNGKACIDMQPNDTLIFRINDTEHQNNRGHFKVNLVFADTALANF